MRSMLVFYIIFIVDVKKVHYKQKLSFLFSKFFLACLKSRILTPMSQSNNTQIIS